MSALTQSGRTDAEVSSTPHSVARPLSTCPDLAATHLTVITMAKSASLVLLLLFCLSQVSANLLGIENPLGLRNQLGLRNPVERKLRGGRDKNRGNDEDDRESPILDLAKEVRERARFVLTSKSWAADDPSQDMSVSNEVFTWLSVQGPGDDGGMLGLTTPPLVSTNLDNTNKDFNEA